MAAEAGEEIGAALEGVEQLESVDGAAGAVGHAVFDADHDGRLGGALDDARGEDADDAAMPAVAIDHQQPVGGEFGVGGEAAFDGGERGGFGVAALAVEPLELGGQFLRRGPQSRVVKSSMTSEATSMRPAALMRGARRKATSKPVSCFGGGIERGGGKQRAQARAHGLAQLAQAQRGDDAILAAQRHGIGNGGDGRHLEKAGQSFLAGADGVAALQHRLRQLERDGRAAERFFRVGAAGLIGIENGERVRERRRRPRAGDGR